MDVVRQAAEKGEPEGLLVWALEQTSGRGRHGRVWAGPDGNLAFSFLLRPYAPRSDFGHYSFIASLAVSDIVSELTGSKMVRLKWPNDVLIAEKKISGILLEGGEDFLNIGIGLNVLKIPETVDQSATSLCAEGSTESDLQTILHKLLKAFDLWQDCYHNDGFGPIRESWIHRAQTGHASVKLPQGEIKGEFVDITKSGYLRLRLPDGHETVITAGDVFFEKGTQKCS